MDIKSISSSEISKPSATENKSFDPDKRIDVGKNQYTKESSGYNVDKRLVIDNNKNINKSEVAGDNKNTSMLETRVPDNINELKENSENQNVDNSEQVSGCPIDGHGGNWDGERGNSTWYPNRDEIPKNPKTNPEELTWGQILDKYGIDGIPFKDGEPDFSEVSKGTVEIDNFSENRYGKGGNFDQACERLAEQRGCTKEEVKAWMKENKYTWHERSDCKTMDKVPTEVGAK